jgi:hypothetical protein
VETVQDIALHQGYISTTISDFRNGDAIVSQVFAAGQVCRDQHTYRLALYFPYPPGSQLSTFQVYHIVAEVDPHWNRRTLVALILAYQPTPLEDFGILVARNRGILAKLFTDEAEGLLWLRQMAV